ncbi:MAG: hypothetical protein IPG72_15700 [Ardenticatenales bacterium]|jgi:hypothetical protein|nr:hypothetical protein [Ardenticatenales bacterium]
MPATTDSMTDGAAAAAILAAGIGSAMLGLLTTGAEASAALKTALTLSTGVGPLSGKVIGATVAYFASWLILHFLWRDKDINFGRMTTIAAVLIGIGVLLTFPLVFQAFTPPA